MFQIKEDIDSKTYCEFTFSPIIKIIYPDLSYCYLYLDLNFIPKEGTKFNSVYKYSEIQINGIDMNGYIDGYIKLDYLIPQLTQ